MRKGSFATAGRAVLATLCLALLTPGPVLAAPEDEPGWQGDASLGFTFSRLTNDPYAKETIPAMGGVPEHTEIIRTQRDVGIPGLALMAHLHRRLTGDVRFGPTIGVALTRTHPQLLAGGSILVGPNSRWALTGGIAMSRVLRLADQFAPGDTVDSDADIRRSRYDYDWFVGVSYVFTRRDEPRPRRCPDPVEPWLQPGGMEAEQNGKPHRKSRDS